MVTRREFFGKIKTAVMGAGAAAAIVAVIPAKPASKETFWWLGKDFKWTGFVPAKDQTIQGKPFTYKELEDAWTDAMKGGDQPDYIYTTKQGMYGWQKVLKGHYNESIS